MAHVPEPSESSKCLRHVISVSQPARTQNVLLPTVVVEPFACSTPFPNEICWKVAKQTNHLRQNLLRVTRDRVMREEEATGRPFVNLESRLKGSDQRHCRGKEIMHVQASPNSIYLQGDPIRHLR